MATDDLILHRYKEGFEACEAQLYEMRTKMAKVIQKSFLEFIGTLPMGSSCEMQETAKVINSDLSKLGLAVKDPVSGQPADFGVDASDGHPRFRLVRLDVPGRRARTKAFRDLQNCQLELIPCTTGLHFSRRHGGVAR